MLRAWARGGAGAAALFRGDGVRAVALFEQAIQVARDAGNVFVERASLSWLDLATGRHGGPTTVPERASRATAMLGEFAAGIVSQLIGLVLALQDLDRPDDAATLAGFLYEHADALGVGLRTMGLMADRPIEGFRVTAPAAFDRGREISRDDLAAMLRTMASMECVAM